MTATARAAALARAPFRVLVKLYDDASALLARSARWVLPFFFTVWGLANPNPEPSPKPNPNSHPSTDQNPNSNPKHLPQP